MKITAFFILIMCSLSWYLVLSNPYHFGFLEQTLSIIIVILAVIQFLVVKED